MAGFLEKLLFDYFSFQNIFSGIQYALLKRLFKKVFVTKNDRDIQ
jgi:hypothetical protein